MDRLDEISLSRIATILDKHTIIRTDNNSIWERIISNAGQSVLYEEFRSSLTPYTYNGGYPNTNELFNEFYSAIKSILKRVYSNGENASEFYQLISSIIDEIDIQNLFDSDLEK